MAKDKYVIRLYFIRHGQTEFNAQGRVQGWSDSPLTAQGYAATEIIARKLAEIRFDYAFCSDFQRTRRTAEIILAHNSAKPKLVELSGLREINFGKYESGPESVMWGDALRVMGLTTRQELFVNGRFRHEALEIIADNDETGAAERPEAFVERLMLTLADIVARVKAGGGENVLVVSHGAAIRMIVTRLGGEVYGVLPNSSLTVISWADGIYTVEQESDTSFGIHNPAT